MLETAPLTTKPITCDACALTFGTHPNCVVCGRENPRGLQLQFGLTNDDIVECSFYCSKALEGYPGRLHGGVIASVLDGAMTNCLFMHGYTAVTAELNIRYMNPVVIDSIATVHGWIERGSSLLYILNAEIVQDGKVMAPANGKFMDLPKQVVKE